MPSKGYVGLDETRSFHLPYSCVSPSLCRTAAGSCSPALYGSKCFSARAPKSYSRTFRKRSALPTTLTDDSAIAAAAMIGDSMMPKAG